MDINKIISFENEGTINKNSVYFYGFKFYFSYKTFIAFRFGGLTFCKANDWGKTTGKFLNEIEPNHKNRLNEEEFNLKLRGCLIEAGILNKEILKNL